MKAVGVLVVLGLIIAALVGTVWFLGSTNPVTPAGYVGYVTQGAVFGEAKFIKTQSGPTSPGRHWMYDVTNISITPYTYSEPFKGNDGIITKDDLLLQFQVHIVFKINSEKVQQFVENFSTIDPNAKVAVSPDKIVEAAYTNRFKEPIRTCTRDNVQVLNGMGVKDNIAELSKKLLKKAREIAADTPFEILDVVVGNIQYPNEVTDAVSKKLATSQLWEQKQTEIEIEKRDAEKRVIQAQGIADSMNIINQKLTPAYLQHEAIEAQKLMVGSPNHTTVYIPVGPMGVPLTGTFDSKTGK
jgi:regulator of protease activity HflC (stomatin/prohibitin superfamily)